MEDIGVLIGRFQVNKLHDAHRVLINTVRDNHKKVIIFLGVSSTIGTKRNPLDFQTRQKMIMSEYSDVLILPIKDCRSDVVWSNKLNEKTREVYPIGDVLLYGGRDSFIPYYNGPFKTQEIGEDQFISGTAIREQLRKEVGDSEDFRAGVIYGTLNRYPTAFPTVDIAIHKDNEGTDGQLLLAKKPNEEGWRFVGGFVDPKDESLEYTCRREVTEETGVEIDSIKYISSHKVSDWRYKKETDGIITSLFVAKYIFGKPEPNDDIEQLKWFDIDKLFEDSERPTQWPYLVDEHKPLMNEFLNYYSNRIKRGL